MEAWSEAAELSIPEKALAFANGDSFPNIRTLLHTMATLPITSCECEQHVSTGEVSS